jgi:biopolymer transport protein ExbB/TolQ
MPSNPSIDAQLLDLMLRAGARWVLWLLLGLSVLAVSVMLERLWFFARARRSGRRVAAALAALRSSGPAAALGMLAGAGSMDVAVAQACLANPSEGTAAIEEHVLAALDRERLRYERGLAFLGTLGNNAPFIGLFGTVLGIVRSFHDLSANVGLGTQAVMAGIAESLVATGIGLLVALPAVAMFNAFTRHVETTVTSAGSLGHEILAFLKALQPAAASATGAPGPGDEVP